MLLFVLLPLIALKACQWSDAHPSDQEMRREFAQYRAEFGRLLAMVRSEKHLTRIADDFIWVDGVNTVEGDQRRQYLSDNRYQQYRRLFALLKLESGIVKRQDGSVGFLRSSSGMVTSGSSKEFVWSPSLPTSALVKSDPRSLEGACVPKTGCSSIRQIAPNWYIEYESN